MFFKQALELLTQLSPKQISVTGDTVINRGRIVVVTALESDARFQQLVTAVEQQLQVQSHYWVFQNGKIDHKPHQDYCQELELWWCQGTNLAMAKANFGVVFPN